MNPYWISETEYEGIKYFTVLEITTGLVKKESNGSEWVAGTLIYDTDPEMIKNYKNIEVDLKYLRPMTDLEYVTHKLLGHIPNF